MPRRLPAAKFPSELAVLVPDFEFIDCAQPDWRVRVGAVLKQDAWGEDEGNETHQVLLTVLNEAYSRGVRTILVESYVSTDWADEYQAWYSRLFRHIPKLAKRLHFFAGIGKTERELKPADLLNLESLTDSQPGVYLGYSIVRPFTPLTVGETVLTIPSAEGLHVPCAAVFPVHILGQILTVRGMPFMEQDEGVAVCVGANLWMVARYRNAKGETRRYRPSEIAKLASLDGHLGPTRDGLTLDQTYSALSRMGFTPDQVTPRSFDDAMEHFASHLTSGIPIIVSLQGLDQGHAVTVIGYVEARKNGSWLKRGHEKAGIEALVVHDDQFGPYRIVKVKKRKVEGRTFTDFVDIKGSQKMLGCLVSLPERVHLREIDVRTFLDKWLDKVLPDIRRHHVELKDFWTDEQLQGFSTRIFLLRGEELRKRVSSVNLRRKKPALGRLAFVTVYRGLRFPKHVWVVELLDKRNSEKILGHMVFDATSHPRDRLNSLLVLYLDGRLLWRMEDASETDAESSQSGWEYIGRFPRGSGESIAFV